LRRVRERVGRTYAYFKVGKGSWRCLAGGVVIGFTNPKVVHAVTAALVQVTNTSSNPVVTEGAAHQASQIVNLYCPSAGNCIQNGSSVDYIAPANETLVINSIDITPVDCAQRTSVTFGEGDNIATYQILAAWLISPAATTHMTYPSGFLMKSGLPINLVAIPSCSANNYVHGYLTPN
jgi:hypothetical protein